MKFKNIGKKNTESKIKKFEEKLSINIPLQYRNFLLAQNGGIPEKSTFLLKDKKNNRDEEISIEWFLGIKTKDYDDLKSILSTFKKRIPTQLFPIALAGGDSLICLGTTGKYLDKIYFWDREEELEKNDLSYFGNIYFLGNNFSDFLKKLYE